MTDKVVDIHGTPVTRAPGVTDPKVVAFIEDLLRRAKEGKILGLCGGLMMENNEMHKFCETHIFCDTGCHNAMVGLLEVAKHRLVIKLLED